MGGVSIARTSESQSDWYAAVERETNGHSGGQGEPYEPLGLDNGSS